MCMHQTPITQTERNSFCSKCAYTASENQITMIKDNSRLEYQNIGGTNPSIFWTIMVKMLKSIKEIAYLSCFFTSKGGKNYMF